MKEINRNKRLIELVGTMVNNDTEGMQKTFGLMTKTLQFLLFLEWKI